MAKDFNSIPNLFNVASSLFGAQASASSFAPYLSIYPFNANDGNLTGGFYWNGGGASTSTSAPEWLEVNLGSAFTVSKAVLYFCQDNANNPTQATDTTTGSNYVVTAFKLQYFDGTNWIDIPGTAVTGNNLIKRTFTFSDVNAQRFRVFVTGAADGQARIVEVELYSTRPPVGQPRKIVATLVNNATAIANSTLITNSSSKLLVTLPTEASSQIGDDVRVIGQGTGGWTVTLNSGQIIHGATDTSANGSLSSSARYDAVLLKKIAANEWSIVSFRGNLNIS